MKNLKKILTAATLVAAASSASAIQFDLVALSFNPGSGYSTGTNALTEVFGNLSQLGVDFSVDGTDRSFDLTAGNTSASYKFGDIKLEDGSTAAAFICDGSRGFPCFRTNEKNDLEVSATFRFTNPSGVGERTVTALGTATFGFINDSNVDFSIAWDDEIVSFGNGGEFHIHMEDISFSSNGETVAQTYTIDMVTAPIPEPETYALMLAGLGLVGFMARRRKQA
jgi:hypothetical protein